MVSRLVGVQHSMVWAWCSCPLLRAGCRRAASAFSTACSTVCMPLSRSLCWLARCTVQMFIGCPSPKFEYTLESLGGVRIITSYIRTTKDHGTERIQRRETGFSFVAVERTNSFEGEGGIGVPRHDSFASFA